MFTGEFGAYHDVNRGVWGATNGAGGAVAGELQGARLHRRHRGARRFGSAIPLFLFDSLRRHRGARRLGSTVAAAARPPPTLFDSHHYGYVTLMLHLVETTARPIP